MLNFFRKSANGWFIKTLMVLLAMTFVLWGIGDTLRSKNKVVAFSVGDEDVSAFEWQKAYNSQVSQIEDQIGRKITEDEAIAMGVNRVILNQLINKTILSQEARKLGLLVSDDMVKYEISTVPTFQKDGKFNKEIFQQVLRSSGLSEQELVEIIRESIANENLITLQNINRTLPKSYIETLTRAKGETRGVKVYKLPSKNIKVGVPKDEDLKKIFDANLDKFSIPEKRDLNYITFDISNIKTQPLVTDDEIAERYENNTMIYTVPDTRKVSQLVFKSEEESQKAFEELSAGKSFSEVAKKYFPTKSNFLLGDKVSRGNFDAEIENAIFQTEVGQISSVVKSPLGLHIFKIESESKGRTKELKEVKEHLIKQIEDEKKFEALSELAQNIDSDITIGSSIADIASKYSLELYNLIEWDPVNGVKNGVTGDSRFATSAFTAEANTATSVTPYEGNNKFFALEVAKIQPKNPKNISDVKGDLLRIWIEAERANKAYKSSKDAVASIEKGVNESVVLKANSLVITNSDLKISQLDKKSDLDIQLRDAAFGLEVGQLSDPIRDNNGDFQFIKLLSITPLKDSEIATNTKAIEYELFNGVGEEMTQQYLSYLRSKYDIKIYEDVVKVN